MRKFHVEMSYLISESVSFYRNKTVLIHRRSETLCFVSGVSCSEALETSSEPVFDIYLPALPSVTSLQCADQSLTADLFDLVPNIIASNQAMISLFLPFLCGISCLGTSMQACT